MITIRKFVLCGIVSTTALMSSPPPILAQETDRTEDSATSGIAKLYGFLNDESLGESRQLTEKLAEFTREREQIRHFLARKGVKATEEAIDRRLESVERVLAREGKTLESALAAADTNEQALRDALEVPVAWNSYLRLVLTEDTIRNEFLSNRSRYDGTKVQLAQIFRSGDGDADETRKDMEELHKAIQTGGTTFANAVKAKSTSPSASEGGRIGAVRFRGDVPHQVSAWAFDAATGDVSHPIETPFGYHIVKVLGREPGNRSLEDARAEVITALSDRLWADALRSVAR